MTGRWACWVCRSCFRHNAAIARTFLLPYWGHPDGLVLAAPAGANDRLHCKLLLRRHLIRKQDTVFNWCIDDESFRTIWQHSTDSLMLVIVPVSSVIPANAHRSRSLLLQPRFFRVWLSFVRGPSVWVVFYFVVIAFGSRHVIGWLVGAPCGHRGIQINTNTLWSSGVI